MNSVFKNSLVSRREDYLNSDFEYRLQSIQSLLKRSKIDGLLVINGADGAENLESVKFTNYLLRGFSGHQVFQNTEVDMSFEESMILVTPIGFSIFIEAEAYKKVNTVLLSLNNPYVFVPQGDILDNQDLLENLKIREFYRFVYDKPSLGVLLPKESEGRVMEVEQWPIIKAYAIDGIGGGFLTMRHKLKNLSSELNSLYMRLDMLPKKVIINQISKRLINNRELIINQIGAMRQKNKCCDLDQEEIGELLTQTFEISSMNRAVPITCTLPKVGLTFGTNTIDWSKEKTRINQTGHLPGCSALHMVFENVDPLHMVQYSRTYFLTSNTLKTAKVVPVENFSGYVDSYEATIEKDPFYADEYKLTSIYLKTLQSYYKFTSNLHQNCKENVISKVEKAIEKKILALEEKLTKKENLTVVNESVEVQVSAYDMMGVSHTLHDIQESGEDFRAYLIVVKILVKNIHSVIDPSKDVPYFDFFEARPENSQAVLEVKELFAQNILGTRIQKRCGIVQLYIPFIDTLDRNKIDFPLVDTEVAWFERGFKVFCEKIGHFILYFSDIQKFELFRPNDNPWIICTLKENLFFSKLTQPVICLRFYRESQLNIFVNFKEKMAELESTVPIEDIINYPEYMKASITLQKLRIILKNEIPHNFEEGSEIMKDKDFIKFNTRLEELKVLSLDDQTQVDDIDVVKLIDNQVARKSAAPEIEQQKTINLFVVVGPPFSGKRAFGQSIWDLRNQFPVESEGEFCMVSYEEADLNDLTVDSYFDQILDTVRVEEGKDGLNFGDWVLVIVPHTISHLELLAKLYADIRFTIRASCAKINLNDLYNKNDNPIRYLRRYLEEGYVTHCFADYEGMESHKYERFSNWLERAFPHMVFQEVGQNKIIWSRLEKVFKVSPMDRLRGEVLRQYNKSTYSFNEKLIRLDYRIPILEGQLHLFREVIIDLEGALLYPEPEPEPESDEVLRERHMNLRLRAQDELKENIRKLKAVMRGLIAKRDQGTSIPFITRMKGVFRFEGKIEKGPYSLYLSPHGFYFENLGIPTELEEIEKQGLKLYKSTYEGFEFADLGFYIYGQNLDPKAITLWFNKNLLPKVDLKKPIQKSDIPAEKIKELERQKSSWGLDGEYVFDGYAFRDMWGRTQKTHPRMPEILEEYLTEENKKITEDNTTKKEREKYRRKFYSNM